jgi:hypothetical protein
MQWMCSDKRPWEKGPGVVQKPGAMPTSRYLIPDCEMEFA